MSRGFAVSSLGLVVLFAGCRFPELPVIGEDAGDAPEADALIDAPPSSDAVDAAIDAVDARPVRTGPLVTNGQAADLVIGQPSFGTNADRGVTAQSFQPDGIAFASGRLWATDYFHRRVLGWNSPTASDPAAGYLLGQSLFTVDADQGVSQTSIFQAQDVEAVGTKVLVADGMNRVLIWTSLPVAAAQPADLVLGQPDFTTANVGTGPSQMRVPWGLWSDGARVLARGGFLTSRIWSWTSFPAVNAAPAAAVLAGGVGANASEFRSTGGVTSDGTRMVVADPGNHRVLIWNTIPATTGQPADIVLGQPDFASVTAGTGAARMSTPTGVAIIDGALLVADAGNDRVLVFDPLPTASGAAAAQVLGQSSTATAVLDQTPSDRTMNEPTDLAFDGRHLFVADRTNRRVLRYTLNLP
ncbi:hypothetical protein [Sphingomonas sp.]|jgi:hypothetical protein|uniref:hypothetical protein n=1 Tax=Sphingomonas sp. TaxID=28214 RepID=UPI002DD68304|nr:hypothetical protein [Sphingomonas sp.]